jgi:hypothetical protein
MEEMPRRAKLIRINKCFAAAPLGIGNSLLSAEYKRISRQIVDTLCRRRRTMTAIDAQLQYRPN